MNTYTAHVHAFDTDILLLPLIGIDLQCYHGAVGEGGSWEDVAVQAGPDFI